MTYTSYYIYIQETWALYHVYMYIYIFFCIWHTLYIIYIYKRPEHCMMHICIYEYFSIWHTRTGLGNQICPKIREHMKRDLHPWQGHQIQRTTNADSVGVITRWISSKGTWSCTSATTQTGSVSTITQSLEIGGKWNGSV